MKRSNRLSGLRRQSGVAAIWLGLSLVPIMGFTFWAVEGTRYIQEKSRLGDASEAAAIAVTMATTMDAPTDEQDKQAQALATKYVNAYVRDIKKSQVIVNKAYQPSDSDSGLLEYAQYTVDIKTTHDSWFSSTFIPSFDETQDLTGMSIAKKYPSFLGDNNIDIVFVSDFSGSMNRTWKDNRGNYSSCNYWDSDDCKIGDLKVAVSQIAESLLCADIKSDENDEDVCLDEDQGTLANKLLNRVSIVPYNIRTREKDKNGNAYAASQLRYLDSVNADDSPKSFEQVDWDIWRQYYAWEVYDCSQYEDDCPTIGSKNKKNLHRQSQRIVSALGITRYVKKCDWWSCKWVDNENLYHVDRFSYLDATATIRDMFIDKYLNYKFEYKTDSNNRFYSGFGNKNSDQFENIPLTNELAKIVSIDAMYANGSTAVYQGILKGLQELNEGKPDNDDELEVYNTKIKMMLILSDGQETPDAKIFPALVNAKLCDVAREKIPGLYIGVIGIDFSASDESGFQECVLDPENDIIDVSDGLDELIEKIEELIRKGSKTSGTTKLY
ncbi:hypothetical protein BCU70_06865 [Vibrio sp. 10N.286.49.C2]|uniref:TadE/TadG family type IV pilus assembly protein n=1 Tax=unclassified Vibrio TaxID=2614977 RepID=UPI000C81D398|nr:MULTISPECIES: TadE/TadG family type IV pilus assembly protein [unclassified Vibrio]PMH31607.1 hypothetical protein BCU70_06865 [Vibrio sp. 10N.286.49.C2]PMH50629.1 hypothetical protein BCU66_19225 [Vibrio sp. 10N.286.49.B1]PMH82801.1 hypothetical protein BCU58_16855 [Vibrio sp. 10N.286.48.B7]